MGITSLELVERAMYSASVIDIAVIVCILEAHVMGAPAKRTSQPECDLEVIGLTWASHCRQLPAKSASTQQSNCHISLGRMINPLSLVDKRYRLILFTASVWLRFGFSEKCAHWCMLMEISGCVDFSKKLSLPMTLR